ncbi:hypothetical protein DFH09DRAFT_1072441 [Mycena vulgaris]|nr:hypothetical protein DFH09DRAFT_1072441 [Mycena vulgaris]
MFVPCLLLTQTLSQTAASHRLYRDLQVTAGLARSQLQQASAIFHLKIFSLKNLKCSTSANADLPETLWEFIDNVDLPETLPNDRRFERKTETRGWCRGVTFLTQNTTQFYGELRQNKEDVRGTPVSGPS